MLLNRHSLPKAARLVLRIQVARISSRIKRLMLKLKNRGRITEINRLLQSGHLTNTLRGSLHSQLILLKRGPKQRRALTPKTQKSFMLIENFEREMMPYHNQLNQYEKFLKRIKKDYKKARRHPLLPRFRKRAKKLKREMEAAQRDMNKLKAYFRDRFNMLKGQLAGSFAKSKRLRNRLNLAKKTLQFVV